MDNLSVASTATTMTQPQQKLYEDLRRMLESRRSSDVVFLVGEKSFPAHSVFLAVRCPELLSATRAATTAGEPPKKGKPVAPVAPAGQRVLKLDNFDEELITELLRYIYTGKVDRLRVMAKRLLEVAIEYKLDELKEMCEETLCENLSLNNCVSYLIFSDKYKSCYGLKHQAMEYIKEHRKDVVDTVTFNKLAENHPNLLEEILRAIIKEEPWNFLLIDIDCLLKYIILLSWFFSPKNKIL